MITVPEYNYFYKHWYRVCYCWFLAGFLLLANDIGRLSSRHCSWAPSNANQEPMGAARYGYVP